MHIPEKTSVTSDVIKSETSVLRLIYPQWQGGVVDHWMPDIPSEDASKGYFLGAQLLKMLAPESTAITAEIPVSLDIRDRAIEKGIHSRQVIVKQTGVALDIVRENAPGKIVTLGGECSVSVVPFTYLAAKYPDDVAIVWLDAHPDVNLPDDEYKGYHAMALTACLGMGDEQIMRMLPGKIDASKALLVGLRAWDKGMKERQREIGIRGLSPADVAKDSSAVMQWLQSTGVSKVLVHFDLDVLDPAEIIAGVGVEPGGMKMEEAVRVIRDIALTYDLVGLTVAEFMPRIAIKLKRMLGQLPLLKERHRL